MTTQKVEKATVKAHVLDSETRQLLDSVRAKNKRATTAFIICFSILLIVGIAGIYRQNQLAVQNQEHIDCIVKLLATPLPSGSNHKVIEYLDGECHVKFAE